MYEYDKVKVAISVLKYSPIEAAQELYYPTTDQNRINRNLSTPDIFDYTPEQRQAAADYLVNALVFGDEELDYRQVDTIRLLMQLNLPYPKLRESLKTIWHKATGF